MVAFHMLALDLLFLSRENIHIHFSPSHNPPDHRASEQHSRSPALAGDRHRHGQSPTEQHEAHEGNVTGWLINRRHNTNTAKWGDFFPEQGTHNDPAATPRGIVSLSDGIPAYILVALNLL